MRRSVGPVGLLAALVLAWPAAAADKKDKKNDPAAKATTPQDYQALADAHTVTGKLTSVGGSDKSIGLRVEYQVLQPNPHANKGSTRNVQHLLHEQQEILRTRNPLVRAARLQQLEARILNQEAKAVNSALKVAREHKEFDLDSTDKVTVRYLEPPAQYDDKGFPKKYTAAELKELKGNNSDLPGYAAEFDKLLPGQTVRVTLARPKADKEKNKDAAAGDSKPQVSMIVIVAEAPTSDPPAKGKKK
jgi:hypothetical protein